MHVSISATLHARLSWRFVHGLPRIYTIESYKAKTPCWMLIALYVAPPCFLSPESGFLMHCAVSSHALGCNPPHRIGQHGFPLLCISRYIADVMCRLLQLTWAVAYILAVHLLQCLDPLCMICEADETIAFRFILLVILDYPAFCIAWKLIERLGQYIFIHLLKACFDQTSVSTMTILLYPYQHV